MSFENRGSGPTPSTAPVYTIYPGEHRGSTNYGFHGGHPQAPPPKYEDVISGEYLKPNYTPYTPSSVTHEPAGPGCHYACSDAASQRLPPPPQPEHSREEKSHNAVGAFLFGFLLIAIFIWRVLVS